MSVPCEEIRPELETLLAQMTDGALDAAGRRRLAEILHDHPEARQFYLEYCQMHALLTASHGVLHVLDLPKVQRRRRILIWAAAAAAVLLVAWLKRPAERIDVGVQGIESEGEFHILREGRRVSFPKALPLQPGDRWVTEAQTKTTLTLDDGSSLVLSPSTDLQFNADASGRRYDLKEGKLRCNIAPQPPARPLVFATPHAEATILGTEFDLSAEWNETRLRTTLGRVRLSVEGRSIEVKAGEIGSAGRQGLVLWHPIVDLDFARLRQLPAEMDVRFCRADILETLNRPIELAPEKLRFVQGGITLGPDKVGGLVVARWKEEVGEDLILEADVVGKGPWSLGFAVSGDSFEGYRIIFAAMDKYPNGVAIDTIFPAEHIVLARDPRPISYDRDHVVRVERRGKRMRAWVDQDLRIDTEIDHPLDEGRRRVFSISNFGSLPIVRALRVWKAATP